MKKHFKLLIAALLVGSVAFFSACSDDDDDDDVTPDLPAPSISLKTGDNYTSSDVAVAEGTEVTVGIEASQADGNLEAFTVTMNGVEQSDYTEIVADSAFSKDITITKSDAETETWTFKVTNEDGDADSVTIVLSLEATPFAYENTADGAIYHRWGQYPGAYDLVMNYTMSQDSLDVNKDMENTSPEGEPFTATWKAGDGNTTTFIKAEGYDYENATVESANAALAAGDPVSEITTEAVAGDVYIANLRGTGEPCVIYIQEVSQDDPLKSGTGYMYFAYKKTSENAGQ